MKETDRVHRKPDMDISSLNNSKCNAKFDKIQNLINNKKVNLELTNECYIPVNQINTS